MLKIGDYIFMRKESMKRHSSIKIGGLTKCLIIPLSKSALMRIIKRYNKRGVQFVLVGNCSNVLISDNYHDKIFIKNVRACNDISFDGKNVRVGSSIFLNELVKFCISKELFGMEFLFYIPGTVGGAIYMNAGRGEKYKLSISNYIVSVEIFDGIKIIHLTKKQCEFSFRKSIFQNRNWIILSCTLELPKQKNIVGLNSIVRRKKFIQKTQDLKFPSAGTVFKTNFKIGNLLKGSKIGGAQFSLKTPSFIINKGEASFDDVMKLIELANNEHKKKLLPEPKLELILIE